MKEDSPEFKKVKEQIMQLSPEDKLVVLERIMESLEDTKNDNIYCSYWASLNNSGTL